MPEKEEEEETPERGVRRIDMRALERGVRKALEIKPKDQKGKKQENEEHPARKESNLHLSRRK